MSSRGIYFDIIFQNLIFKYATGLCIGDMGQLLAIDDTIKACSCRLTSYDMAVGYSYVALNP